MPHNAPANPSQALTTHFTPQAVKCLVPVACALGHLDAGAGTQQQPQQPSLHHHQPEQPLQHLGLGSGLGSVSAKQQQQREENAMKQEEGGDGSEGVDEGESSAEEDDLGETRSVAGVREQSQEGRVGGEGGEEEEEDEEGEEDADEEDGGDGDEPMDTQYQVCEFYWRD